MITGISRYKKGSFDQSVLDEVYDLAKVKYIDPIAPPSSGVELNSIDLIWDDMHKATTVRPVAATDWRQFVGPVFAGSLPTTDAWQKTNAWYEIEEATDPFVACGKMSSTAINTRIELMCPDGYVLDYDGTWTHFAGNKDIGGSNFPIEGNDNFDDFLRGCTQQFIEDERLAYLNYSVEQGFTSNGTALYRPDHYKWFHGWANQHVIANADITKAVFHTTWVRLVLIDPTGVDDRHLARFIIHGASDLKSLNNTFPAGYGGHGIGGVSGYKLIPQNGDWMASNFLDGYITKAELEANPPPFMTTPY